MSEESAKEPEKIGHGIIIGLIIVSFSIGSLLGTAFGWLLFGCGLIVYDICSAIFSEKGNP